MIEKLILMKVPGRSRAHQIPQSSLASTSASENLQSRCNSNYSFGCLHSSLLDHYTWLALTCHRLGNTPPILLLPSHHHLHHSISAAISHRPILVSFDLEACQHRKNCWRPRWEIWRYSSCRCAHLLCKSFGRSFHFSMHVSLLWHLFYE